MEIKQSLSREFDILKSKIVFYPNASDGITLIWSFDMEKVNGIPLYWLAFSIGYLQQALNDPKASLLSISQAVKGAQFNLKIFRDNAAVSLPLTINAINETISQFNKLYEGKENSLALAIELSEIDKNAILGHIFTLQVILQNELPQLNIFYVAPNRAYDMTTLINQGENLLRHSRNSIFYKRRYQRCYNWGRKVFPL